MSGSGSVGYQIFRGQGKAAGSEEPGNVQPSGRKKTRVVWHSRTSEEGLKRKPGAVSCYDTTLSIIHLTGVFICSFFSCRWKALEDFMQSTDLSRKEIWKGHNVGCVNIEFSLEEQKSVHPFCFLTY